MDATSPTSPYLFDGSFTLRGCSAYEGFSNADFYRSSFRVETRDGHWRTLTNAERFGLVSSLYGPGNLLGWFFLILSVLISWTANPVSRRKDTITNDFIAVLTMPVVAVVHFFYMVAQQRGKTIKGWLGCRQELDVIAVGALEAPLTVCEDFIACAAVLFSVAASRGHPRRLALVLCVGLLCLAPEVLLLVEWLPYGSGSLLRPFIFHSAFFFCSLILWESLTLLVYLAEIFSTVSVAAAERLGIRTRADAERGHGAKFGLRMLSPGYLASRMSAVSAFVAAAGSIWIKYGLLLQMGAFNSVRFIPRSPFNVLDLDQAIAAAGGLVALGFSVQGAFKERKKARERQQRHEMPPWQRWGR
ncbi:hypothetical protein N656DRAFT_844739 [Canariomyces notabilis]|uniref:Uncharacterized protein n=1 Tax=Canariomyces notabilis TaxID=2074819 RepID=A0AAN6TEX8_9PEZI|nr:hypothetical protein N656DRAFT_844739 [Canariomyces arenarius]